MKKIVLITGCSSGIGHALAKAFLANGDTVIATARRVSSLDSLRAAGCEVEPLDVTSEESRNELIASIAKKHPTIDVLINNAGISAMGPMVEIPEDKLKQQFDTNVIAPVMLVQAALPLLRKSGNPKILNVGSISAVLTTPFAGAYCASKAALHSISEAMRLELEPLNIEVITVQPGAIRSNFGEAAAQGVRDWLSEKSLYHSIEDGILARANASQKNATPAEQFAKELVERIDAKEGSIVSIGKGSRLYPIIARWLPEQRRTRLLQRRFGLNKLNP